MNRSKRPYVDETRRFREGRSMRYDTVCAIRRHRHGREVSDMFGPYWISAATADLPASAVSKSRTDFGMEASRQSTHFCRAENTAGKTPHMPLQTALAPARVNTRSPGRVTALRRVISLLRRWRDRVQSRPQLYELDDHILQDIGLTREALLLEEGWRFRR
jgi:uncharacterized protein YjiS (DUF1127 family)